MTNDKQNFSDKLCSADNFQCYNPRMYFYRQDAQATSTKTLLSEPVYDIASLIENPPFLQSQFPFVMYAKNVQTPDNPIGSNNACLINEHVEVFDCGITSRPTHKVPAGETFMPNFEAAMNNHVVPPEKNLHQFRHAKETFVDCYSLAEQNTEQYFGNEYSLSNQSDYMKLENLRRDERILLSKGENERLKNNFPSNRDGKDQYIPNALILSVANQLLAVSEGNNSQVEHSDFKFKKDGAILSNERGINHIDNDSSLGGNGNEHYIQNPAIWNMAIQLLTSEGNNSQIQASHFIDKKENGSLSSGREYKQVQNDISCIDDKLVVLSEENYSEVSNQAFIKHPPQNEISVKYCQFYRQISSEDYDFAMNIMAYIEFLNDSTWSATVTYFEENIKNMVRNVWDQNKNAVNSNSMLEQCYRDDFLNAMGYFSEFASKKKYKISEFLQYCVMMCQLGVFARKRNFKEAPLHVIDYLRNGISNIEHYHSIMFEIDIKNYAQELSAPTLM